MRSPAPPLGSLGSQWIEGAPSSYLDLVVTSSGSQWPSLQVTVLWVDTRKECGYAEEKESVIHFLSQCPFLARCRYGSPTLVSLTELSSIDVKDIASFMKLSDRSSADQLLRPLLGAPWSAQKLSVECHTFKIMVTRRVIITFQQY